MYIANIFGHVSFLKAQILAYVEYFGQFTADSEQFPEDVAQVPHPVHLVYVVAKYMPNVFNLCIFPFCFYAAHSKLLPIERKTLGR